MEIVLIMLSWLLATSKLYEFFNDYKKGSFFWASCELVLAIAFMAVMVTVIGYCTWQKLASQEVNMYFITVFEGLEPSELFGMVYKDRRTWGYYAEYEQAVSALHLNKADMHEGCYEHALIEKIGEGISANVEEKQWFYWDKNSQGYFEIEEPEYVKRVTNFAIG